MTTKELPFPPIGEPNKKYTLTEKLYLEQWIIPKGTEVSLYQGRNNGIIALPEECFDARGFAVPKRLFKV